MEDTRYSYISLFCISVIGFYVIAAGINQSLDFLQKFCYNIYVRNKEKAKAYKKNQGSI